MKSLSFFSTLLFALVFLFGAEVAAQKKPLKLELDVTNPLVQSVIKKALQEYIPRVTGKNEKVKDIQLLTNKKSGEVVQLKGTVIFQDEKAALGNGNYRFKLKMNSNILQPKIHSLKLQTFRVWFIRFYKRVI